MLKIGVLGAGHLGKIHIKLIKEINAFDLVGFYDPNQEMAEETAREFDLKKYDNIDDLIQDVEAIDIVTPTLSHYECALKAVRQSKHLFIEKPITNTLAEAKELISLVSEANVKAQVGHVERFNPAFVAAEEYINQPMFMEIHRLAQFNPRGTDVSVVLDLMIHDIDIVLSVVNSGIKSINASGVAVISDAPDIANARIEFNNGCVANITASRISMKTTRKCRIFQSDAYVSIDFLERQAEIIRIKSIEGEPDPLAILVDPGNGKPKKQIYFERPASPETNAIKDELISFAKSINENTETRVTVEDGFKALDLAYKILDKLKVTPNLIEE